MVSSASLSPLPRSVTMRLSTRLAPLAFIVVACSSTPSPPPVPAGTDAPLSPSHPAASTAPGAAAPAVASGAPRAMASAAPSSFPSTGPKASSAPSTAAPPPPAGPCPPDMVDVKVACIDRYEAPNQAGSKPLLMQSQPEALAYCAAQGKRLCTETEWVRACKGPSAWRYPYGPKYDEHACNQDKKHIAPSWGKLGKWPSAEAKAEAERLDQAEPSGSRPGCVSPEGVFDLTGNAGEWVVRQGSHPEACKSDEEKSHKHVVMGCFWGKCFRAPHEPSCEYVNCAHADGFHSYEFGVRCCRDLAPSATPPVSEDSP